MIEPFIALNKIPSKNTKNITNHQIGFKSQLSLFHQMPVTYNHKNSFGRQLFPQSFENKTQITIPFATTSNKLLVKRSNPVEMDILIEKKPKSENSITSNDSTPVITPLIHSQQSHSIQEYGSFSEIDHKKDDLYSFFVSDVDDNLEEELNENLSSIEKEDIDSGFCDFLSDDEYEKHESSLIKDILELKILKQQPYNVKFEDLERKERKNRLL